MPDIYSTREVAELLGVDVWKVQRLFESGALNEPPRFAGKRCISRNTIPAIAAALRERGWVPTIEKSPA